MQRREAVRRKAKISSRELLKRLIPVDRLDAVSREEYLRLLSLDDERERLEGVTKLLEKLCELGYLRRVESAEVDGPSRVSYRDLSTLNTISITLPDQPGPAAPSRQAPPVSKTGAGLSSRAQASGSEASHVARSKSRASGLLPMSILEAVAASSRRIDLASAMGHLYDLLVDTVGCDSFAVVMSSGLSGSPAGRLSELEEVFRWPESELTSPSELRSDVEEKGEVLLIPDLSAPGHYRRRLGSEAVGSLLVAPLRAEAYVYGVLELWSQRPHAYTSDDVAVAGFVAEFMGGLIKRRLEVEELIFVDHTSQIHNRRYFDEQLAREVERCKRTGNAMALLVGDLDDFKMINDTLGHAAGDSVLRQVGRILSENARQLDIVARIGGEEFGVILPNVERDTALAVAERMRSTIARHRFVTGVKDTPTCSVTVSMGGALYPLDAKSRTDLVDKADRIALYEAKRRGKNRVIFWQDIQSN